jgi:SHS2 domain-containing protein
MYELFEHTADLGMRIAADDLAGLFAEAGRGLFAMLVENLDDVRPQRTLGFRVEGRELDYLLLDWLNELLFAFESQRVLLCDFNVTLDDNGLTAQAAGEEIDPARHRLDHEVKAITYHHLQVEQADGRWRAEVIVDI